MTDSIEIEVQSVRAEFAEIIRELVTARMDYQATVKPDTQSVVDATKVFLPKLDEARKALSSWNDKTMARIEQCFLAEGVSVPKQDDPFWNVIRQTNAWGWIITFDTEKDRIEAWLQANEKQNAAVP